MLWKDQGAGDIVPQEGTALPMALWCAGEGVLCDIAF